jgi:hypothetical protein
VVLKEWLQQKDRSPALLKKPPEGFRKNQYVWQPNPCAPWCWYIYLQNWVIFRANVGKYTSTMEHMGKGGFPMMLPSETRTNHDKSPFGAQLVI